MKYLKKYPLISILILVLSFFAGRFSSPKQVEIRENEKIVYRDRVTQNDKKQTRKETRETILPDGTRIRETIQERQSETRTDSERSGSSEKSKEMITKNQSQWSVGVYTDKKFFSATVDRRIFGGLFLGIYGRSELDGRVPEVGLGLRLEF